MTTMTLTAKSYAELEPVEAFVRALGISVRIERQESEKSEARKRFDKLCEESRKFAKEVGLTPDDITAAIKRVKAEERAEMGKKTVCA